MEDVKRSLPPDWRWVKLGEVCEIIIGRTPRRDIPEYWGGKLPWVAISDLNTSMLFETKECITEKGAQESRSRLLPSGTLMFSFKLTIGKMSVAGVDLFTNEAIAGLIPKRKDTILRDYLKLALSTVDLLSHSSHAVKGNTLNLENLNNIEIPLPSLEKQQYLINLLTTQLSAVDQARAAAESQLELVAQLIHTYLYNSLTVSPIHRVKLGDCLQEISKGVGSLWNKYPLLGATRAGIAPAKEGVGKTPERYKLVEAGTIFYNPMRILLGSIAFVDEGDISGITSPDYVVFKAQSGALHFRWFYYWLRSSWGAEFIKTLARGAVRERMLFRRLADAEIEVPAWDIQVEAAKKLAMIPKLECSIQVQLDYINQLPAALLQKAFNGEL